MYHPQWKNEEKVDGDLESIFKITWCELAGYAKQAAQGMAFLEEKKVYNFHFSVFVIFSTDTITKISLHVLYRLRITNKIPTRGVK